MRIRISLASVDVQTARRVLFYPEQRRISICMPAACAPGGASRLECVRMFSPSTLHDLASGRRRGLRANLLRGLLSVLELPVDWYMRRRNQAYDIGFAKIRRADAPVISVGN